MTFKIRLPVRGELHRSLNIYLVRTVAKMMERIKQHARMKDDILQEEKLKANKYESRY